MIKVLKIFFMTLVIAADFPFGALVIADLWLYLDLLFARFCRLCLM